MSKSPSSTNTAEWCQLTWAQQTFYQAKYGITNSEGTEVNLSELSFEGKSPGSNDRLHSFLSQGGVSLTACHPRGTLLHTGPDDSVIVTNEIGWGLPYSEPPDSYTELDDQYMCPWEISQATWTPEAPYWATCPDC